MLLIKRMTAASLARTHEDHDELKRGKEVWLASTQLVGQCDLVLELESRPLAAMMFISRSIITMTMLDS